MDRICILICTFNRENELRRCVDSIITNFDKIKLDIVIFNYNNKKYKFYSNNKFVKIKVINNISNNGKTFNILNFVKNNYIKYKYFMPMDDKDYFIKKADDYFLNISDKYKLYSIPMCYINHPNGLDQSTKSNEIDTMYNYYLRKRTIKNGDRLWIFNGELLKDVKILDFYKSEISIQGMLVNYNYYNENFINISLEPLVCREYSANGYSNNRSTKWIKDSPNSELYECFLFYKLSKNILLKLYLLIVYNKKYKLIDKKAISPECKKIKHKTYWIYIIFFMLWPFVKI